MSHYRDFDQATEDFFESVDLKRERREFGLDLQHLPTPKPLILTPLRPSVPDAGVGEGDQPTPRKPAASEQRRGQERKGA